MFSLIHCQVGIWGHSNTSTAKALCDIFVIGDLRVVSKVIVWGYHDEAPATDASSVASVLLWYCAVVLPEIVARVCYRKEAIDSLVAHVKANVIWLYSSSCACCMLA